VYAVCAVQNKIQPVKSKPGPIAAHRKSLAPENRHGAQPRPIEAIAHNSSGLRAAHQTTSPKRWLNKPD
jgi:hypothetical protein